MQKSRQSRQKPVLRIPADVQRIPSRHALIGCSTRHHIVIIRPTYLDRIIDGRKQIECRISKLRKPPFETVATGDLLWFKLPSRAICAFAVAGSCHFHRLDDPTALRKFVRKYERRICAEPEYLEDATRWARYVSLIEIQSIVRIKPMPVRKSDQRAWVVLDQMPYPDMSIGGELSLRRSVKQRNE